jgi:8-oxo-dGTP diphosphatase
MHAYLCKVAAPDFVMKEHVDFKWLPASELDFLDWAEADKPIVEWLKNRF